ncbi:MAG: 4-hydroxy-tetrahydrodipicolinate synthase [Candidatus Omnitrophica bacterium]|nr:4-hydroxy-tetrahydrodipicolinate synthase [Candidatus Omnitrophota bacterium]
MFKGSIVAIVTPFKNGKVDEATLRKLVRFHIDNGTSGIVPCGTTGESPTLDYEEHDRVVEVCIEAAQGKVPVIAGTGSNSTAEAITMTKHAAKAGADASLQVSPYYNKPTQKGLYEHFKAISESVDIPIILYNIASRTGVNILPETMAKMARDCKNIVGVKEASGDLDQMAQIRALCPSDFQLISGDDSLTLPLMAIVGIGVISVVANIAAKDVATMVDEFLKGNIKEAQELHYKLLPLIEAVFIETNPIPVKTAMGLMGMCSPEMRLPLCSMSEGNLAKLKRTLKDYGLMR